jgi:hypothetical protein
LFERYEGCCLLCVNIRNKGVWFAGFHMGAFDVEELTEEDASSIAATIKRAAEVYATPAYATMSKNCIAQVAHLPGCTLFTLNGIRMTCSFPLFVFAYVTMVHHLLTWLVDND